MKIMIYSCSDNEEVELYLKYAKKYGAQLAFCEDYLSIDNAELARGYEGVSIIVSDMNAEVLQKLSEIGVKYMTTRSIGFDHFDLEKAKELGLKISTVAYSQNSVANYTIMLILMSCRKIKYIMEKHKIQDFSLVGKKGVELSKSTVGIIGTGRIGRTVIQRLSGFGCKILAYDIYKNDEVAKIAEYVDIDILLEQSDIVSFHVPSTPENYHLINDESLSKMKKGVMIVNTARGDLIDTEALIKAIESGKVGMVALDVVENESDLYYHDLTTKVINNRELAVLRSFPNVILTPHTAWYTYEAMENIIEYAVKGCTLFAKGKENPLEVI